MRLSDVHGERTFEVVAKVIPSIISIASDKRVTEALSSKVDGCTDEELAAKKAERVLPLILGEHRADTVRILAAIKGVSPEEFMAGVNLMTLTVDVFEMLTDEVILGFLAPQGSSRGSSDGVSVSTEG